MRAVLVRGCSRRTVGLPAGGRPRRTWGQTPQRRITRPKKRETYFYLSLGRNPNINPFRNTLSRVGHQSVAPSPFSRSNPCLSDLRLRLLCRITDTRDSSLREVTLHYGGGGSLVRGPSAPTLTKNFRKKFIFLKNFSQSETVGPNSCHPTSVK